MRFVLIDTENTRPMIEAIGVDADVLTVRGRSRGGTVPISSLNEIAIRNATRRAIRYPLIYGHKPIRTAYRALYRRKITRRYGAIEAQLAAGTGRTALVFNGFLAPNALVDLAAEQLGMQRLFVENGFFPDTLQADIAGINGFSSLPRDAAFYDELSEASLGPEWPSEFVARPSKITKKKDSGRFPDRFVFVPFQVPSDMQILALSPWISDMRHLLSEICGLARAHPHRNFVIKEHPSFPLSVQGSVPTPSNVYFANHTATRFLTENCECLITVNSTVGLEALVQGKKVITLGNAHYAVEGLTLQVNDTKSLNAAFEHVAGWQFNEKRRDAFVRFVFNRFLLRGSRQNPTADTVHQLKERAARIDEFSRLTCTKHNERWPNRGTFHKS
ncbi:MAG: nitrogen fixation protein FixF [Pseudomonadota bacterium]